MRGKIVKIRVLMDCTLRTYYETHYLIKGEVKVIRFKNYNAANEILKFEQFALARTDEEEVRQVPVIFPEVFEDSIVAVEQEISVNIDVEEVIENGNETQNSKCDPTD